jgi:hypothetical protein
MSYMVYENGEYREATEEEAAEIEARMAAAFEPPPAVEDRVTDLEAETSQIAEIVNILVSGETGGTE